MAVVIMGGDGGALSISSESSSDDSSSEASGYQMAPAIKIVTENGGDSGVDSSQGVTDTSVAESGASDEPPSSEDESSSSSSSSSAPRGDGGGGDGGEGGSGMNGGAASRSDHSLGSKDPKSRTRRPSHSGTMGRRQMSVSGKYGMGYSGDDSEDGEGRQGYSLDHAKASLMRNTATTSSTKRFAESLSARVDAASGTEFQTSVAYYALPGNDENDAFHAISFRVKDDWTVQMLKETLAESIDLESHEYFDIADTSERGVDRWLNPRKTLKSENVTANTRLVMKIKIWKTPAAMEDPMHVSLLYAQIVNHIHNDVFVASDVRALRLASYSVQILHGDYDPEVHSRDYLTESVINAILPTRIFASMPLSYFNHRLQEMHSKYIGHFATTEEAMLKYIDIARQLPSYGLSTYDLEEVDSGSSVVLAAAGDGLLYCTMSRDISRFIPFSQLRGWVVTETPTLRVRVAIVAAGPVDSEVVSEEEVYEYSGSESALRACAELLTIYFNMAVVHQERTDEGVERRLASVEADPCTGVIPPPDRYLPMERRILRTAVFSSRLEVLKTSLKANFDQAGADHLVRLWHAIDDALDNNRWLEELDLSSCGANDSTFAVVTAAMVDAFSYDPPDGETITENVKIRVMDWSNNSLSSSGCAAVAQNLHALHLPLAVINLYGNRVSNKGMRVLASSLASFPRIKTINLGACDIGNKGCADVMSMLRDNQSIETIILRGNRIGDSNWPELIGEVLATHASLTHLDLSHNKISDTGLNAIVAGLQASEPQSLRHLNVEGNKFSAKALHALCEHVATDEGLVSLSIGYNKSSNDTGKFVAEMLAANNRLLEVNLSSLNLSKGSGKAVLDAAATSESLLMLNMDKTGLDHKCGEALVNCLIRNSSLTSVSACDNKLGNGGVKWAPMLDANTQLIALNLSNNNLKSEDLKELCVGLASNKTLRLLTLDRNGYGSAGLEAMSSALQDNTGLHTLSMQASKIGDNALVLLVPALKSNTTLVSLSLKDNALSNKSLNRLVEALSSNSSLQILNLQGNKLSDFTAIAAEIDVPEIVCHVVV